MIRRLRAWSELHAVAADALACDMPVDEVRRIMSTSKRLAASSGYYPAAHYARVMLDTWLAREES